MPALLVSIFGALLWQAPALAQTVGEVSYFLEKQLRCTDTPNPTPVLQYLLKAGYINKIPEGGDNISCWKLSHLFIAHDLPIEAICAMELDPVLLALSPTLYKRGPGNAETQISVFSDAAGDKIQNWVKLHLDSPLTHYELIEAKGDQSYLPMSFSSGTFIGCDELSISSVGQELFHSTSSNAAASSLSLWIIRVRT